MKEKPILFSGPMVRAILDGRKTQTRRVGKIQSPTYTELGFAVAKHATKGDIIQATYRAYPDGGSARWALCEFPYGYIGHRLWVKETFAKAEDDGGHTWIQYQADNALVISPRDFPQGKVVGWRPSIHMFRWASRITLEITGVRVERLREISMADVLAEGCILSTSKTEPLDYQNLWESINGAGSWKNNPWVWVVEFKKL